MEGLKCWKFKDSSIPFIAEESAILISTINDYDDGYDDDNDDDGYDDNDYDNDDNDDRVYKVGILYILKGLKYSVYIHYYKVLIIFWVMVIQEMGY